MVDWTSLLFMVAYVPMVFPVSYMMDKIGLRWTGIVGCLVTTLGSWIKVLSVSPDRFYVTFIGQALIASTQVSTWHIHLSIMILTDISALWRGRLLMNRLVSMNIFTTNVHRLVYLLPPNKSNTTIFESNVSVLTISCTVTRYRLKLSLIKPTQTEIMRAYRCLQLVKAVCPCMLMP